MTILVHLTFNVKLPRRPEFGEWITKREEEIEKKNEFPEGWKYRGTYCTRFSNSGYEYLMLLEIDKYGRLDDFRDFVSKLSYLSIGELQSFLDGVLHWTFYESSSFKESTGIGMESPR
jgi:hypothetical protein